MGEKNEIKGTSFRVFSEDNEKFKEFCVENNLSQAEAFNSILNIVEMSRARESLSDREKEIDTFQNLINSLMKIYISSLTINDTFTKNLSDKFDEELKAKEKLLIELQEELSKEKEEKKAFEENSKESLKENQKLEDSLNEIKSELNEKNLLNLNLNNQLKTMSSIVAEYKEFKDINNSLEKDNKKLKIESESLNIQIKKLEDKIDNLQNMINFYKEQTTTLKENIVNEKRECSESIKAIKEEFNAEKENYSNIIEETKKEYLESIETIKRDYDKKFEEYKLIYEDKIKLKNEEILFYQEKEKNC